MKLSYQDFSMSNLCGPMTFFMCKGPGEDWITQS